MRKRTIYRDTETGRFAKKSTWTRSKAHGGDRYKRERVAHRKPRPPLPPIPPPPEPPEPPFPPEEPEDIDFEDEDVY